LPVAAPNWQPITHLDMSMPNIFLQPPAQAGGVRQNTQIFNPIYMLTIPGYHNGPV
jgi:hypothetical protein